MFQTLGYGDRKCCSLVFRRWFRVEGHSRHRISLNAQSDLVHAAPQIFACFDCITKLALKCDRRSASIGNEALILISVRFRNLTRLKLCACCAITDDVTYPIFLWHIFMSELTRLHVHTMVFVLAYTRGM